MINKKLETRKQIINHIMISGKKNTSETLFLKSLKKLQINSIKQSKKIVQLCLINSTSIFKLHTSINKHLKKRNRKVRVMPSFIEKSHERKSLGIKLIILNLRKKKSNNYFFTSLTNEILQVADNKGFIPEIKKETQKKVLINKRYLKHYRW